MRPMQLSRRRTREQTSVGPVAGADVKALAKPNHMDGAIPQPVSRDSFRSNAAHNEHVGAIASSTLELEVHGLRS
jgi:hypothetical protein